MEILLSDTQPGKAVLFQWIRLWKKLTNQSSAGIIGFTQRKEAVYKWNLIKYEKAKMETSWTNGCQMDQDDEYSLHYGFSDRIGKADKRILPLVQF